MEYNFKILLLEAFTRFGWVHWVKFPADISSRSAMETPERCVKPVQN